MFLLFVSAVDFTDRLVVVWTQDEDVTKDEAEVEDEAKDAEEATTRRSSQPRHRSGDAGVTVSKTQTLVTATDTQDCRAIAIVLIN